MAFVLGLDKTVHSKAVLQSVTLHITAEANILCLGGYIVWCTVPARHGSLPELRRRWSKDYIYIIDAHSECRRCFLLAYGVS